MFKKFNLSASPLLIILALTLSACSLPSSSTATGRGFAFIWYVATDGNDSNSCLYPDDACLTIKEAITKSEAQDSRLAAEHEDLFSVEHTINIGPGIYREDESRFPIQIQNNVSLVGAGRDTTIIDAEHLWAGVVFRGQANGSIENLTIQNGTADPAGSCLGLAFGTEANAEIENVTFLNCPVGIRHNGLGLLTLTNVHVTGSAGPGLFDAGHGETIVRISEFVGNASCGIMAPSIGTNLSVSGSLIQDNGLDGIFSGGTINILRSTISNNGSGVSGTGLVLVSGTATVSESYFLNNHLAGVGVESGAFLTIDNSTVAGNRAGGLSFGGDGTILSVTVRENGRLHADTSTVGAVYVGGALRIQDSIIQANHSGGIFVDDTGNLTVLDTSIDGNFNQHPGIWNFGTADIQYSTISNNSHYGIENRGTMSITNSTISGNTTFGIISGEGSLNLSYVTVAYNNGSGLVSSAGGSAVRLIENSIFANNTDRDCAFGTGLPVPAPALSGTNLDTDGECEFSSILTPDLNLGPLGDNGGPTFTHALLLGSPAIDPATGPCPSTDQTHAARPVGLACDVGAYELGGTPASLPEAVDTPAANKNSICYWGPGEEYGTVNSIPKDTEVILLGVGENGNWIIVDTPINPGIACWSPEGDFDLDPDLDLSKLPEYPVPPLPDEVPDSNGDVNGKPAAPSNLTLIEDCDLNQGGDNTVTLSWEDNSDNETGFRVYRNGVLIALLPVNTTVYADKSVPSGNYNYSVEAVNSAGVSARASMKIDFVC